MRKVVIPIAGKAIEEGGLMEEGDLVDQAEVQALSPVGVSTTTKWDILPLGSWRTRVLTLMEERGESIWCRRMKRL